MPRLFFIVLRLCVLVLWAAGGSAIAKPLVIIDAGHGGHDRGGMPGQLVAEKIYALDTSKRLERELQKRGFRTLMTRRSDVFVSLADRVAIANRQRNAIFISVHYNGAANKDASGIETYYASGRASASLASSIHRAVLAASGAEDRRVRSRGFYVIRRTKMPAVLCELGFLTNRAETRKVKSSSYRQKLAEAVARGIDALY